MSDQPRPNLVDKVVRGDVTKFIYETACCKDAGFSGSVHAAHPEPFECRCKVCGQVYRFDVNGKEL